MPSRVPIRITENNRIVVRTSEASYYPAVYEIDGEYRFQLDISGPLSEETFVTPLGALVAVLQKINIQDVLSIMANEAQKDGTYFDD